MFQPNNGTKQHTIPMFQSNNGTTQHTTQQRTTNTCHLLPMVQIKTSQTPQNIKNSCSRSTKKASGNKTVLLNHRAKYMPEERVKATSCGGLTQQATQHDEKKKTNSMKHPRICKEPYVEDSGDEVQGWFMLCC